MTDKTDAVDTLLAVIDQVVECTETAKGERETWELLVARVPTVADAMSFNTYRMRATTMVRTWKAAMARLASERTYSQDIQPGPVADIHQDIQEASSIDIQKDIQNPQTGKGFNLAGWYVQPGKDGFFRAYRKQDKKTKCIYIGKDSAKAQERIQAWERKQNGHAS